MSAVRCVLCRAEAPHVDEDGACDACVAHPVCADCRTARVAALWTHCADCERAFDARHERYLDAIVGADPEMRRLVTLHGGA